LKNSNLRDQNPSKLLAIIKRHQVGKMPATLAGLLPTSSQLLNTTHLFSPLLPLTC